MPLSQKRSKSQSKSDSHLSPMSPDGVGIGGVGVRSVGIAESSETESVLTSLMTTGPSNG